MSDSRREFDSLLIQRLSDLNQTAGKKMPVREPGYYWVRDGTGWEPVRWSGAVWDGHLNDADFIEVGPRAYSPDEKQREPLEDAGTIDYSQLEAKARAASVGPWRLRSMGSDCFVEAPGSPVMPYRLDVCGDDYTGHGEEEQRRRSFEFIAACDPQVVLTLIARLREKGEPMTNAPQQAP